MSLASMASGDSCGPANPMAQLSKLYSQDRGAQGDHFNPQPGPSSQPFRQAGPAPSHQLGQAAQQFFAPANSHLPPLDLAELTRALPQSATATQPTPTWATAFAASELQHHSPSPVSHPAFQQAFTGSRPSERWADDFGRQRQQTQAQVQQGRVESQNGMQRMGMMGLQRPMAQLAQPGWLASSLPASAATDWETAFLAQERSQPGASAALDGYTNEQLTRSTTPPARPESPGTQSRARDALAETAAALLSSVERAESHAPTESGTKMAQSTFLELMRKLRDGEVEVQGERVVEQIEPVSRVDRKGKRRALDEAEPSAIEQFAKAQHEYAVQQSMERQDHRDALEQSYYGESAPSQAGIGLGDLWVDEDRAREQREQEGKPKERHVQFQGDGGVLGAGAGWEEDFDDFSADMIAGGHGRPAQKAFVPSAQQREWHALQDDWDQFEATATGFSTAPVIGGYRFAAENAYLHPTTRTHERHAAGLQPALSTYDSVLEHEAAVQREPQSAPAWLALGVKQQENERESLAISALQQATSLDPTLGEAHLALAISYTNENERPLAYEAVERWVNTLASRYPGVVERFKSEWGELGLRDTLEGKHAWLTELLIELARRGGDEVDAEVQVGLGVLFNVSEEYDKAADCFEAALAVQPDDPLLYNRLGATYANSGKTTLAMEYYLEAVELRPGYVRARFNLAVANLNMGQYEEAARHLIAALEIQQEENERDQQQPAKEQGTSQALWDSLRTALLMLQRSDLSTLASERNLAAISDALGSEAVY